MPINNFKLEIVSTQGIIYECETESVYLHGAEGEFELLPYHSALMASLVESDVCIAGKDPLPIKNGVVMFRNNECTIVVETDAEFQGSVKGWS